MRILLTAIFSILLTAIHAQPLRFHHLTVKDGLPHNGVIALGQDASGHIWVATFRGLCIYNGQQFIPLPTSQLPDSRVDRIHRDSKGTMWVQCFEHHDEVSYYDTLSNRFFTYKLSNMPDSIRQFAVPPYIRTFTDPHSSTVWTVDKHLLWQRDTLHPAEQFAYTKQRAIDAGLLDESVNTLLLDKWNTLWVGTVSNGLFFADTRHSHYRRIALCPTPLARAVCMDRKGILWTAVGPDGLKKVIPPYYESVSYPMTDSIEGRFVRTILEDDQQNLWMATHGGLYVKASDKDEFQRIILQKSRGEQVYSLCRDSQGRLWIGAGAGLFRLDSNKQGTPVLIDSLRCFILDMAIDGTGLWMATEEGLFCRNTNGQVTQWSHEAARVVEVDAAGGVWIGTDNGICHISGKELQHVASPADGHIVKSLKCRHDFVWCSYDQGICCINIYTHKTTLLRTEYNEYIERSGFLDARNGNIYFGGTHGIDCFAADSLDGQLRSTASQLWLEERIEELDMRGSASAVPAWSFMLMLLIGVGGFGCTLYYIRRRRKTANDAELPETKAESPFILKATAIAEAHIADTEFTAEQMAQEMAMSRSKLFVIMKTETGKAVMEFVRDIRLDYAARLLKEGIPVSEISIKCGFSDPSSFSRSFTRKFGTPPSQYRVTQGL